MTDALTSNIKNFTFAHFIKTCAFLYSIKLVSPVMGKLRHFAMPRKIEDQSFCFSGLTEVDFQEVLTDRGICYAFNSDAKLLTKTSQFVSVECLNLFFKFKIFFRVSLDFFESQTITSKCKDQILISKAKTFTIDSNEKYVVSCSSHTVSLKIHGPDDFSSSNFFDVRNFAFTRILLNPKITTTDDALRKYSPNM